MDPAATPRQRLLARFGPWLLFGAFVLVLAAALFSYRLAVPTAAIDLDAAGRVAVLPVVNATGEPEHDWVRLGLMEMIAETLRRTPGVEVVEPARLPAALAARGLDSDAAAARPRVRELALALGGELVLDVEARRSTRRGAGDAELYSLRFAVVDRAGATIGEGELRGTEPVRIAERLTSQLAGALAARAAPVAMRRVYSSSPFLNRLYGMGRAAAATADPEAASRFFEIVLEIEPGFLAARLAQAEQARRAGRLEESRQLFLAVLEEAQNRAERVWEGRTLHALAVTTALLGKTGEAVTLATQVPSLPALAGDRAARLAVLRDLARFALGGGDEARAAELYREAGTLQQELGDRLGRVDTLAQLGALALRAGDLDAAERDLAEARDLAQELGDVHTEMQVLASLGEIASRRGDAAAAIAMWQRAASFYAQRGEAARSLLLTRNVAEAVLRGGDLAAAEDAFHDVRELAVAAGDATLEGLASLRLAYILLRRGYPYQARPFLDRALKLDRRIDEPLTLQRLIAWMAYEEGNYRLAVDTLSALKRQAGDAWHELDEGFLAAFTRALERGERVPLPAE
jgi:tetratricopeptide (TPR) repeat protein